VVVAGLQGDIQVGALGRLPRSCQGLHLGMGQPGPAVIAPAHHLPSLTTTAPTMGLGLDPSPRPGRPGAGRASCNRFLVIIVSNSAS